MIERKKILVLNDFQRWFLRNFVLYTALFLGVLGVGLYLWFQIVIKEMINLAGLLSPTFMLAIEKYMGLGVLVVGLLMLVLLTLAAFHSLMFSRKIAGPLFALARHFEKCEEEGQLSPIHLRKDDLFSDIADKFNKLSNTINKA